MSKFFKKKVEGRKVESRKKENEQLRKNNVDVKIKESVEKAREKKILKKIKIWQTGLTEISLKKFYLKKDLNTLNKIKIADIVKHKRHTPKHKELLNFFNDLLNIILTDKTLESESQEDKNKNENEKVESRNEENKKVESRKEENENEDYDCDYENEDEDDYEMKITM